MKSQPLHLKFGRDQYQSGNGFNYHIEWKINKIPISGAETSLEEAASAVALQQRSEEPEKPLQVGDGKFELFYTLT